MFPLQKQQLKVLNENELRFAIVEEAKSWLNTPFHHEGRVKKSGVDCGMLLLEVFERVDCIPHVKPSHYPIDFMLHSNREWYMEIISEYAYEIFRNPLPGDVILYKHGRIYSHGAIIIDWPKIIHASMPDQEVCYAQAGQSWLLNRPYKMFRYDMFEKNGDDLK